MTRPLRVLFDGALYHVIARGNAKQNIFLDDGDRFVFLDWLEEIVKNHNLIIHAYCLMDNHYHLLIETPDANLSKAMRDLNGNYSQSFNARQGRCGHLFQGRYKAFVVEKESYLLAVARYIVLNSVRAGLVDHPGMWKWSSYNATVGIGKKPHWLEVDWLLKNFSQDKASAQKAYKKFVMDGIVADPYEDLEHNLILGTPQFVHWIWDNYTSGSEVIKEHPREQRIVGRPSLEDLFRDGMTRKERDEAIIFARIRCGYLTTEIADHVGLDRSVVGKISRGKYGNEK